ncbi:MAG: signal peptidase I [Actinobacteria bacterium HGW-Actinobacteria-6]|nr:MAG: signal peptidase I [Actinobacteria bacterium HGW-Actinobacteria-6]
MPESSGGDRFRMTRRVAKFVTVAAWGLVAVFFGATLIRGGSMQPTVAPGDVVVYRRSAQGLRAGDIVYFDHPEWPRGVVHRVVAVLPDGSVTTRGDANPVDDRDSIPQRRIRGVATVVIPSGKAVSALIEALR